MFPGINLPRWPAVLQGRLITDRLGENSARDAALALVEVLDPAHAERLAEALVEAVPGMVERFSDKLLSELKEELIQREYANHVHATITLIEEIEQDWRNQQ